jgi:hypothetical protein
MPAVVWDTTERILVAVIPSAGGVGLLHRAAVLPRECGPRSTS